MGSFYANIAVKGASAEAVAAFLDAAGERAYVAPDAGPHALVLCEDEDLEAASDIAAALTGGLGCSALAVLNHDDDVLCYRLYSAGELMDEYDSTPGYFDGTGAAPPDGGNAVLLFQVIGTGVADMARIAQVLRAPRGEDEGGFLFAIDRHRELARALGMSESCAGSGFAYAEQGDDLPGIAPGRLIATGGAERPRPTRRR